MSTGPSPAHTESAGSVYLKRGFYGIDYRVRYGIIYRHERESTNRQNTLIIGTLDFMSQTAARMIHCRIICD